MWDWSTFFHYLHSLYLIKGAGISLALSIGAMAIGLVFGTFYTGLPQLGLKLGVISSALIGLGVNEGAYLAEIIRGWRRISRAR